MKSLAELVEIAQAAVGSASNYRAFADAKATEPTSEKEQAMWDWLKSLDHGRGALLDYFEKLRDEFDADFSHVLAAKLPVPLKSGSLGAIDPAFFAALRVRTFWHTMLLAQGIISLRVD